MATDFEKWPSEELFDRFQKGQDEAAEVLFTRYMLRLTALARVKLAVRLQQQTDPEDISMSVWKSFFAGTQAGRFSISRSGDLWKLLVGITLRKVYRESRRQLSDKRNVNQERTLDVADNIQESLSSQEPSAEESLALIDTMEIVCNQLTPIQQKIFEQRLQGLQIAAIADNLQKSERTIRRQLETIKRLLTHYLD
ncbi:ECF-type sigma factor [Rubinisphaera italica]|uniref:RNA polymerase factor sigma-70 n=1 Tax=Rubinisphaera italica TaxID=2527969 RepID=A0A5C5XP34_9PLAN|nr:ECF-type sigma factor [Rubinisphaera italica]TWT64438.1 RNA polymerase factor sigma-70 [Rubinisphaera italica]